MFHYMGNMSEAEKQKKIENTRIAREIAEENYRRVKEQNALKQQNKDDDQVRSDNSTKMRNWNTANDKLHDKENTRYAEEVSADNYQHVKENNAVQQQDKADDVARRDRSTIMRDLNTVSENLQDEENTRYAKEVSEENYQQVKEHRALKQQDKADDVARRDYNTKMRDLDSKNDNIREKENMVKQTEYRNFLLQQISDKEKQKHKKVDQYAMTSAFSEDLVDPVVKHNLKLQKQREMKNALDECIRQKNALKLADKQKEEDEENERVEFLKKRENEGIVSQEKAKQFAEQKELWKYEVASTWKTNDDKDVEREKFIDTLIEKDSLMRVADNEKMGNQSEAQKKNCFKQELLKQMEEKNQLSAQQAADEKRELQELLAEYQETK